MNQLERLLNTFSAEEHRRFTYFLTSPYHNRNQDLLAVYEERYAAKPIETRPKQEDANDRLQRSELLRLAEIFLVIEDRKAGLERIKDQLKLRIISRSRQQELRQKNAGKRIRKMLAALPDGTAIARIQYESEWEDTAAKLNSRKLQIDEANTTRRLHERSFLLESLRLACESISTQAIDTGQLEVGLLPSVIIYLKKRPAMIRQDRLLSCYFHCLLTLKDANDQLAFNELRKLLRDPVGFDAAETGSILLLAINACIRRINQGQPHAADAAFELYTIGLEKGYLLTNGKVSRFTFSNVVVLALKSGDHERALNFINRYASALEPKVAQSTEALNRARLAYEIGDLVTAMDQLRSARDQDVLTTLNIRLLQMRVYYQLSEFRLLDAHLDALDIYLRRRKDSLGYHYKAYRSLTGFVRKLRRQNIYDKVKMEALRQEVQVTESLPEKNWLLKVLVRDL